MGDDAIRALADSIPQIAWIAEGDGRIFWFNRRWSEFTGLTAAADQAVRLERVHPDQRDRVLARFRQATAAGEPWEDVFQLRGADGEHRWFLSRAHPIHDGAGRRVRWFGTNTDITAQREAESALADETRALETLNRTAAVLAAELDLDKVVQTATDAAVELTRAEFGAFFYNVVDHAGESYTLYTLSGAPRSAFETFPMPRNTAVFGPTFAGEGVVRSDDITRDPRYGLSGPYHGMPKGHLPVRSYLAVPVVSRSGEVLGGLFFGHSAAGVFVERDERVIEGLAAQAAVAIDNARLFAAAQHELGERRRAEAALSQSQARYRTLVETLPQLVWTCRPDGACDYLSSQWIAYTGMAEDEQLGLDWLDRVVHPDDRERTRAHWLGAVAGRHAYDIDYRIRRHDGAYRWFKTRGVAIRDEAGAVTQWFGTCTDIEDIVEARETLARSREVLEAQVRERTAALTEANERLKGEIAEREQAEEALRQAQKMEAIGRLTGGVAHDFNNLLTVITGNLELLQRRLAAGDADVARFAESAISSARRAATLTQRLLAFSRRQSLAPESVDLNALVGGMEDLIARTVGEQIRVRIRPQQGLWRTWCDPNQMENALLNLTINARDAMARGGVLQIATANARIDPDGGATEAELAPGDYVVLTVSDTGEGMSPEVLTRAFDPFFTTKPIGQGTGLGLSQLYGFVKQSGGHAAIVSAPGRGTTVKVYLPRSEAAAADPDPVAQPSPAPSASGDGRTVLVVEDEVLVRLLVVQTLQEAGYSVVDAEDGQAALPIIGSSQPIDLLVTDVGLPGINGRQLAEMARQARPGLKVLFMTGYAHDAGVTGEDLEPGMSLIAKPFPLEAFAAKVEAAFA